MFCAKYDYDNKYIACGKIFLNKKKYNKKKNAEMGQFKFIIPKMANNPI